MSGGHWDYAGYKVQNTLLEISGDPDVRRRWPIIASAFGVMADLFFLAEHEMDDDLSGDIHIEDDATFDRGVVGAILDAALRALPDEMFERGKWATIQAWQASTGYEPEAPR